MMKDVCTYSIEVQEQVVENDLNTLSPLQLEIIQAGPAATAFTVCTDQSGLIGLMRHLHGRGFVFLSVFRER
jgi:hypothetical protein